MNIPAGLRKHLSDLQDNSNVYITANKIGSHHYLCILPQDYFQIISMETAQKSGGPFEPNIQEMIKLAKMMKDAQFCNYDEQGRLIVPKKFLDAAGIKGQVFIIGMHSHIQLWNPEAFNEHIGESNPDVAGRPA